MKRFSHRTCVTCLAMACTAALLGQASLRAEQRPDLPPPPDPPAPRAPEAPVVEDDTPPPAPPGSPDHHGPRRPGGHFGKFHDGASPRGPRGPMSPAHQPKPLTDDEIEELMAMLKQVNPLLADRLEKTRQVSPDRFRQAIQRMAPRLMELLQEQREDPQLFELKMTDRRQSFRLFYLAGKLRAARLKPEKRQEVEQLTQQIRQLLQDNFDTRQKILEYEVKKLAQRIERIRQEISQRQADRDQLIEDRLKELTSGRPLRRW